MSFAGVVANDYVWDDRFLIVNNPAIRQVEHFFAAIVRPILPGTTYFRPLVLASFMAEFRLFGAHPWVSHTVNLGLHLLNTALVMAIAHGLARRLAPRAAAAIAGLIYGLHPALVEPVTWVAGRFDLLVTSCALLALGSGLFLSGWRRNLATACFFLLACFSKEMAVTVPLLLLLLLGIRAKSDGRSGEIRDLIFGDRRIGLWVALALTGCAYLGMRLAFFPHVMHANEELLAELPSQLARISLVGHTLLLYVRMIVMPFTDLNPMHPFFAEQMAHGPYLVTGVIVVVLALAYGVAMIVWRQPVVWYVGAVVVALMPVLNIVPLTIGGNLGHERFLTLPLVFVALLAAHLAGVVLARLPSPRAPHLLAFAMLLWSVVAVVNVRVTVPLWRTDLTLWSWAYAKHPDVVFVQTSLIAAALSQGDTARASEVVERIGQTEVVTLQLLGAVVKVRQHQAAIGLAAIDRVLAEGKLAGTQLPHTEVEQRGIPLKDAYLSAQQGYAYTWLVVLAYGGRAEANLELGNYAAAIHDADIVQFYAREYPPAYVLRAVAWYGLDDVDQGDAQFKLARDTYLPAMLPYILDVRQKAVDTICSKDAAGHPRVCEAHRQGRFGPPPTAQARS
ncbi:hypothetical protein [Niveibacterium umoris]|nr:hypothetical protein [Niveibacterium umoris]